MVINFPWQVPEVPVNDVLERLCQVLSNQERGEKEEDHPKQVLHQLDVQLAIIREQSVSVSHNYEPMNYKNSLSTREG